MGLLLALVVLLDITSDAKRLLAHCLRGMGVEPKQLAVSEVRIKGDDASLTWTAASRRGALLLERRDNRWWWAPNSSDSACGVVFSPYNKNGYIVNVHFPNPPPRAVRIYVRAPTGAEILPSPVPPSSQGGPTDVGYFDIIAPAAQPIAVASGTSVDVWFPFVLDDSLHYDISIFASGKSYGPFESTLFDNVVHFELPAFTIAPGDSLQAEISGSY